MALRIRWPLVIETKIQALTLRLGVVFQLKLNSPLFWLPSMIAVPGVVPDLETAVLSSVPYAENVSILTLADTGDVTGPFVASGHYAAEGRTIADGKRGDEHGGNRCLASRRLSALHDVPGRNAAPASQSCPATRPERIARHSKLRCRRQSQTENRVEQSGNLLMRHVDTITFVVSAPCLYHDGRVGRSRINYRGHCSVIEPARSQPQSG